jgi:MoxR-like ATPase
MAAAVPAAAPARPAAPPAGPLAASQAGSHNSPPAGSPNSPPAGSPKSPPVGTPTTYGSAPAPSRVAPPPTRPAPKGQPSADEARIFAELVGRLSTNVESVVLGKSHVVRLALTALLAEGHVLLEDVPGVGKTTLARAMAASVQGQWRRIQFTPDLLPSDVTGVTIFNQASRTFEFHPGPVFANIVIADEINRASPKTQSALLEVMDERYVTVDGTRHAVPRPFLVVATQNPVEMDGTYRLPEAQLDRFLMKLSVGYPSERVEIEVLRGAAAGRDPDALDPVADTGLVAQLVRLAHRVHIADPLYAYAVRLATATRNHPQVRVGVSPRGVIALTRAASAYALTEGRPYVIPEDVKTLVEPVFAHRLLLSPDAQVRGVAPTEVLQDVLAAVPVPSPAST